MFVLLQHPGKSISFPSLGVESAENQSPALGRILFNMAQVPDISGSPPKWDGKAVDYHLQLSHQYLETQQEQTQWTRHKAYARGPTKIEVGKTSQVQLTVLQLMAQEAKVGNYVEHWSVTQSNLYWKSKRRNGWVNLIVKKSRYISQKCSYLPSIQVPETVFIHKRHFLIIKQQPLILKSSSVERFSCELFMG